MYIFQLFFFLTLKHTCNLQHLAEVWQTYMAFIIFTLGYIIYFNLHSSQCRTEINLTMIFNQISSRTCLFVCLEKYLFYSSFFLTGDCPLSFMKSSRISSNVMGTTNSGFSILSFGTRPVIISAHFISIFSPFL